MKKGEMFEAVVERIEFPSKGVLSIDGVRVVVKNAIPGQKIRFVINKKRNGRCEGRLLEVLEPSSLERKEGVCPHFGDCGGCLYQSLPYEEQLKIKGQQVKELLDGVCDSYEFEGIKGSPIFDGYRNKMEFSFGDEYKDGPLALGMHRRGSFYDIVTTPDCRIVHPDFCRILSATLAYFAGQGIGYYKKLQHVGYLRHLLVRRAVKTGEILVALVTSGQTDTLLRGAETASEGADAVRLTEQAMNQTTEQEQTLLTGWKEALLALDMDGTYAGILHIRNDSLADVVQSDDTTVLYGQEYFYEELLGLKFCITPFSFFQTNSLGAEVLYETARGYVGETKDKVVFDLYSGTGTIAQIIAPVASKVVGVEIIEEAVEAARENAAGNGLANCEFIAGDVLKVIDGLEDKPDLIILDPPRDGIHPKALDKIIDFGVERLVYISCKPTSLVRDLAVFKERGYRMVKACAVDMFPATANVETVVLLSKLKPDDVVKVEIDLDELDATPAETKATYQEIKDYVSQKYGLKAHTAYISQIKRKCGIEMRLNYNLSKKENPKSRPCPAYMEDAIYDALQHFAMV